MCSWACACIVVRVIPLCIPDGKQHTQGPCCVLLILTQPLSPKFRIGLRLVYIVTSYGLNGTLRWWREACIYCYRILRGVTDSSDKTIQTTIQPQPHPHPQHNSRSTFRSFLEHFLTSTRPPSPLPVSFARHRNHYHQQQ